MSALMIFLLVSLVILGLNAIAQVKEMRFALPTMLGRRRKRILYEGPHFLFPLIENIKEENVFSLEEQKSTVKFSFFSGTTEGGGNLEMNLTGLVKWRVDPRILSETGFPKFMEVLPETREEGLEGKIKSEISRLGGLYPWNVFREKRRAVEHFINCILRLEIPYHADKKFLKRLGNSTNSQENQYAEYAKGGEVPRQKRLSFYEDCSQRIGDGLRKEAKDQTSEAEDAYGIRISEFILGILLLSPEATKATEAKEITLRQLEAMEKINDQKKKMAKELTSSDLSQAAIDSAELTLKQAEKKIVSFEGLDLLASLVKKFLERKEG